MSTYTDPEHFSSLGWLTSASTVPQIRKSSACASFLNLGGLAGAAASAATSAAGPWGGAVGGLAGGLGGKAGSSQNVLMPEPKAPRLHKAAGSTALASQVWNSGSLANVFPRPKIRGTVSN